MVVPFITQYMRMVMDTAATTTMAPSWAPFTESAVGLQLCSGLDSSAYLHNYNVLNGRLNHNNQNLAQITSALTST